MTDETPTGRDTSGRFVKRAATAVSAMSRTSDEGIHPMSKVLFGWTERKNIGAILFWVFAVLSVLLVLADLAVDRHEKIGFANSVGFYGLWGFLSFAFVVLMGWPLGRLLRRDENYYGDAGGPPADVDPDLVDTRPGAASGKPEGDA
ncbi:MAG: hypothetical protein C0421_05055 [Hyphomonas sp.]|jgi:hypothetical protein|uniref:hypothetical protein n=1 Tax=Hyphomonas sp. TaxID=87 RepID=UPI0025BAC3A4|nr:hypothetical protein [Hyphomonas sp.]MBA4338194.1 hypothetical protein [Hyphomonas sp.]